MNWTMAAWASSFVSNRRPHILECGRRAFARTKKTQHLIVGGFSSCCLCRAFEWGASESCRQCRVSSDNFCVRLPQDPGLRTLQLHAGGGMGQFCGWLALNLRGHACCWWIGRFVTVENKERKNEKSISIRLDSGGQRPRGHSVAHDSLERWGCGCRVSPSQGSKKGKSQAACLNAERANSHFWPAGSRNCWEWWWRWSS